MCYEGAEGNEMARILIVALLLAGCSETGELALRGDAEIASVCLAWCGTCVAPAPPEFGECINECVVELGQAGCSSVFLGFQYACESRAIVCDQDGSCVCDPEGQCVTEENIAEYALCSEFDMVCGQDGLCIEGVAFEMQSPACRDCLRSGQVVDHRTCRDRCGADCDGEGQGSAACDACMDACRAEVQPQE